MMNVICAATHKTVLLIFFFFFFWVAFCFVTFFFLEGGEREGKEQGATRYDIKFVLNE